MNKLMKISNRELEVLQLISFSFSTHEIARKLFISPETAKSHRKNLLLKLDARNSAGMVRKAFEIGLLSLETKSKLELAS